MVLTPLLQQALQYLHIDGLNPMQEASLRAHDSVDRLILLSDTGSGKTLAFLLPLIKYLAPGQQGTQAMIIAPSRELALQIEKVFKSLGSGYKITCCYGGHKREIEENNLLEPPAVIVGTPGRVADHIRRGNIHTEGINRVVLDEFDKIAELGFLDELAEILAALPALKKYTLVSATDTDMLPECLPQEWEKLNFLSEKKEDATRFSVTWLQTPDRDKLDTLHRLICAIGGRSSIIFCNHRESVARINEYLRENGIASTFYHGAMEQRDRDMALCKFRNGSVHFLVTTDLAARGLDIDHIRYIIHYHLPLDQAAFTHRNGRTARQQKSGTAILLVGPEERLPDYVTDAEAFQLPDNDLQLTPPDKPKWTTLFVAAGKKNKINKIDIVGFLSQQGHLKREDIGLIDVQDFSAFVAVRKSKVAQTLQQINGKKLKNKTIRIEVAK